MSTIQKVSALLAAGVWASAVAVGQPQRADAAAVADSFGEGYQEVHIGAASFQHLNNSSGYEIDWSVDGYLGYTDESFPGRLRGAAGAARRAPRSSRSAPTSTTPLPTGM